MSKVYDALMRAQRDRSGSGEVRSLRDRLRRWIPGQLEAAGRDTVSLYYLDGCGGGVRWIDREAALDVVLGNGRGGQSRYDVLRDAR